LILRKIIKIIATRRQILKLKYAKIDFNIQRSLDPLIGIKEIYFMGVDYVATGGQVSQNLE